MAKVLLVDDDPFFLKLSEEFLKPYPDIKVETAGSPCEAIPKLQTGGYDAVVSDYEMPGMNGIIFLKKIREQRINVPFILFTGRNKEDVMFEAMENGASACLQKGGDLKAQYSALSRQIGEAAREKGGMN